MRKAFCLGVIALLLLLACGGGSGEKESERKTFNPTTDIPSLPEIPAQAQPLQRSVYDDIGVGCGPLAMGGVREGIKPITDFNRPPAAIAREFYERYGIRVLGEYDKKQLKDLATVLQKYQQWKPKDKKLFPDKDLIPIRVIDFADQDLLVQRFGDEADSKKTYNGLWSFPDNRMTLALDSIGDSASLRHTIAHELIHAYRTKVLEDSPDLITITDEVRKREEEYAEIYASEVLRTRPA